MTSTALPGRRKKFIAGYAACDKVHSAYAMMPPVVPLGCHCGQTHLTLYGAAQLQAVKPLVNCSSRRRE